MKGAPLVGLLPTAVTFHPEKRLGTARLIHLVEHGAPPGLPFVPPGMPE